VLGLPESGQYRVGISGSIPIDKLESMDYALVIADPAQRLDLLKRLGIDANIAEAATSPRFSHDIEIRPLHTRSKKRYGIVSLPCSMNQAFLSLLEEAGMNTWHAVDQVALDCFHETPTYRLLTLAPGENAVFVEHAHLGHGSGQMTDKAIVYTIRDGRMHEVFSTVDYDSRTQDSTTYGSPITVETSSFLQISSRVIEETRITSQNDVPLRAERRTWRWETTQAAFKATPFSVVPK
jgi:hypothetical protein